MSLLRPGCTWVKTSPTNRQRYNKPWNMHANTKMYTMGNPNAWWGPQVWKLMDPTSSTIPHFFQLRRTPHHLHALRNARDALFLKKGSCQDCSTTPSELGVPSTHSHSVSMQFHQFLIKTLFSIDFPQKSINQSIDSLFFHFMEPCSSKFFELLRSCFSLWARL